MITANTRIDATGQNVTLNGSNATPYMFAITTGTPRSELELKNLTMTQGVGTIIENLGGKVTLTDCVITENTPSLGPVIVNQNTTGSPGIMTLTDTTVSDNSVSGFAGGIYNNATMTLTRSKVLRNSASVFGGGITNGGTMTLTDSVVSDNNARTMGGIANEGGQMALINTTVSGNRCSYTSGYCGGGIYNYANGTMTLTNSTIKGNYAAGYSGGIHNDVGSTTMTITDSSITDNHADNLVSDGGGITNNAGRMTITNSTISGNSASGHGGGINNCCGSGQMTITNSTISGNTAGTQGGGIYSYIPLTLTNSTISGNTAGTQGGGIYNQASLTLTHVTFSGNSASQGSSLVVYNSNGIATTIVNTLMASSSTTDNCVDAINLIIDGGYNLSSDNTCHLTSGISLPNTNPNLGPLANNGGPTQTHALLAGSLAIDRIPFSANGCGTAITTDQRGIARPQGTACDSGAYEVEAVRDNQPPVVSNVTATPNPVLANANATLSATVDDSTTGNSNIASAEYNVDGGTTWASMSATDGTFNSPTEQVSATLTFSQLGVHTVCVRGTDAAPNTSAGTCITITASQDQGCNYTDHPVVAVVPYNGTDIGQNGSGLRLTSMGRIYDSQGASLYTVWRIRNGSYDDKPIKLDAYKTSWVLEFTGRARTETFIASTIVAGPATHRLFYNNQQVDVKASSNATFNPPPCSN